MRARHSAAAVDSGWVDTASLYYGKRYSSSPREMRIECFEGPPPETADHLVPMTLLTAMTLEEPVRIEGAVSGRLMQSLPQIQTLLQAFGPYFGQELRPVEVEAEAVAPTIYPEGRGVATFFSGGVDSLFAALEHRDELDALVYIHGFDSDGREEQWLARAAEEVRASAALIGLPLVELRTNLEQLLARAVVWPLAHGNVLSAVALSLQPMFRRIYRPGGRSIRRLYPSGEHPMLDPLWSTEATDVVYGDPNMERWQKIERLSENEIAHHHLRVCFERPGERYNCGECHKCLTTMMAMAALGTLDRFTVFAEPLRMEAVAALDSSDVATRLRVQDALDIVEERGGDPALRDALITSLERWIYGLRHPESRTPDFTRGTWRAQQWPELTARPGRTLGE